MVLFWALKWVIAAMLLPQICSALVHLFLCFNCVSTSMSDAQEQPVKTVFDGSNFEVWSREMSSFLKELKLWRYATGEISKPVKEKDEDEIKYNKRLRKWDRRNHRILKWIRNTCASSITPQLDHFETAQQVWDFLSKRYSIANQYQLDEKLHYWKQQEGQSLQDFFSSMKVIWDQLAMFEPKFSCSEDAIKFAQYQDKERVKQFLLALHEDYEPACASLLHRGNFPKLESVVSEVLATREQSITFCKYCKSFLHSASECQKLHSTQNAEQGNESRPLLLPSALADDDQSVDESSSSALIPVTTDRALTSSKKFHKSHPAHPLAKVKFANGYNCDGCRMDGTGLRYRCGTCDFDLHIECMSATPVKTFQGHKCEFFEELPVACKFGRASCDCRRCDACGQMIKGFVYHCAEDEMNFHPKCAMLQSEIPSDGDVRFRLQEEGPSKCKLCGKKQLKGTTKRVPGWSYVNKYGCDFHVHCLMNKLMANQRKSSKGTSITEEDLSLALGGMALILKNKSKRNGGGKDAKYWLKILKTFFSAVSCILLGDPTALIATIVGELLHN